MSMKRYKIFNMSYNMILYLLTAKYKLVTPYRIRKMFESVNLEKQKYNPDGNKNTSICRSK